MHSLRLGLCATTLLQRYYLPFDNPLVLCSHVVEGTAMTEENPFYESDGEQENEPRDPDYENFIERHNKQSRGKAIWISADGVHDDIVQTLLELDLVAWAGGQQEIGQRGRTHWQGMIIFDSRLYASGIEKLLRKVFPRFAWGNLLTGKDIRNMYNYINKSQTRDERFTYEESDELPPIYGGTKKKAEKENGVARAMELIAQTNTLGDAMYEFITNGGSTMQWAEAKTRHIMLEGHKVHMKAAARAKAESLRPWQEHLHDIIIEDPSARDIIVVLDPIGNCGKTWFQKHWTTLHPDTSASISNGKVADLSYIVQQKPLVNTIFYNLTRTVHGIVAYQAIEQFKDGSYCTTKYQGREVKNSPPHMIIFTNEPLNWEACSRDRWQIIEIGKDGRTFNHQNYELYMKNGGKMGVTQLVS